MSSRIPEFNVGIQAAVPEVQWGARQYNRISGIDAPPRPDSFNNVLTNIGQARGIAKDFQAAPLYDKSAEPSFRAMAEETKRQYEFMTRPRAQGGMGITHEVTSGDPYRTSRDMMNDVAGGRIRTLATATTGEHPFFTNDENDMFRAVHDVFGHAGSGRNFNAAGEEAAFRSHYNMFSPAAQGAMATETRGQNSTNNFGGLAKGQFAPNKIALIPSTRLILPAPKQLYIPGGRRTALLTGLSEAVGAQQSATQEHAKSFGTPGNPHPDASWIKE